MNDEQKVLIIMRDLSSNKPEVIAAAQDIHNTRFHGVFNKGDGLAIVVALLRAFFVGMHPELRPHVIEAIRRLLQEEFIKPGEH